jgi:FAD/FMN-containing dehydrogenase
MTEKITIEQLGENFRGPIFQPGDDGYDEARLIYNAMMDKHPRIIARCTNVADVITAVKFGRANDLDTAIRGGGHNGPGLALVDDGLVIDLSAMKGIHIDPEGKTARIEPGCCWGDVDHATHAFGMATVSGVISTTGVGGLTLGRSFLLLVVNWSCKPFKG